MDSKLNLMNIKVQESNEEKQRQNNEISRLKLSVNDRINEAYRLKEMNESLTMQQNEIYTSIEKLTATHDEVLLQAKLNQNKQQMRLKKEKHFINKKAYHINLKAKKVTSLKIDSKKDGLKKYNQQLSNALYNKIIF